MRSPGDSVDCPWESAKARDPCNVGLFPAFSHGRSQPFMFHLNSLFSSVLFCNAFSMKFMLWQHFSFMWSSFQETPPQIQFGTQLIFKTKKRTSSLILQLARSADLLPTNGSLRQQRFLSTSSHFRCHCPLKICNVRPESLQPWQLTILNRIPAKLFCRNIWLFFLELLLGTPNSDQEKRLVSQPHHQTFIASLLSLWLCFECTHFGAVSSIFPQHFARGECPQLESRQNPWACAQNTWTLAVRKVNRVTVCCWSQGGASCCSEASSNWERRSSCERT